MNGDGPLKKKRKTTRNISKFDDFLLINSIDRYNFAFKQFNISSESNSSHFTFPEKPLRLGYMKTCLWVTKPEDTWSPLEINMFESAILTYGKEFSLISKLIGTKDVKEVVDYFYIWKKTKKYEDWKISYFQVP